MIAAHLLNQIPMVSLPRRRQFPRRLFDELSRSEHLAVLEVLHVTMHADRTEQVRDLFVRFNEYFSFTAAMGGLLRLGPNRTFEGFDYVVNAGYPDEWVKLYCHHGWTELDPILKTTLRAPRVYRWREICRRLASTRERDFVVAAQRFGLHDGITMGSLDQENSLVAFCSFATDHDLDAKRLIPLVEYVGHYILQALRRTAPPIAPAETRRIQNLSSRELTVLLWMKTGKTKREIAQLLGVRERTIRFHIERIFAKLDVVSRFQAVALAMEQGLACICGMPP